MLSNTSDRSGFRMAKSALKLRKRQESAERQNQARDEVLDDHRAITSEESHEFEIWIDGHFQRVLENLIHSHIEAENQFYGLQERRQRLESAKSNGKVPSGLKIRGVSAEGWNAQPLQSKFNNIIKEAEIKLLDATITSLETEEQQSKERCVAEKQKVFAAIETWRTSFQSSDATLDIEADEFVKSAKCFAESFYFECAATRASKREAENLKRAAKETKRTEQMETEFTVNEQSVRDMVQRAVRQEVSKLSLVSPSVKASPPPCKNFKSRGKDRPSSKNRKQQRRRDSSQDARNQRSPSPAAKNAQGRRSRSKQRRQPKKLNVRFSDSRSPSVSRRQHSKNGRARGNGAVK